MLELLGSSGIHKVYLWAVMKHNHLYLSRTGCIGIFCEDIVKPSAVYEALFSDVVKHKKQ